jgi:hypothetical protein
MEWMMKVILHAETTYTKNDTYLWLHPPPCTNKILAINSIAHEHPLTEVAMLMAVYVILIRQHPSAVRRRFTKNMNIWELAQGQSAANAAEFQGPCVILLYMLSSTLSSVPRPLGYQVTHSDLETKFTKPKMSEIA